MAHGLLKIADVLKQNDKELLKEWKSAQAGSKQCDIAGWEDSIKESGKEFIARLQRACQTDEFDIESESWAEVKEFLEEFSSSRAQHDFTASDTALFILSLKQPIFARLRQTSASEDLADHLWTVTEVLDRLGLFTARVYQESREEIIRRQQQEMLELSAPVIQIWQDVVTVPIIGVLDSARTQIIMEKLLESIVTTGSKVAILDITGVPTVDTATAQHLIKTVSAARLMGARCIISGIRPQIAQTIVHLGIELNDITTEASMFEALKLALLQRGWTISKIEKENRHVSRVSTNG
ncbi:MAG: STAS domain-containing protein [Candidatus Obscuribacterales bacterium]|nr:STAS domain-containing protein [Candidatus Obscuribacterales bacterium]